MDSSTWVELIRRIPEAQHDNLVAVTCTGAEIMVQKILVLDNEFMIFRGRPAGSAEVPRILLMPFDQVNHLAFNKPLQEAEVKTMFGNGTAAVMVSSPTSTAEIPVAEAAAAAPEESPPPPPAAAQPAPAKTALPSKSFLLARLRARLSKD